MASSKTTSTVNCPLWDSRKIHRLTREFHIEFTRKTNIALVEDDSCDIGFSREFNVEFPRQSMNLPIEFIELSYPCCVSALD